MSADQWAGTAYGTEVWRAHVTWGKPAWEPKTDKSAAESRWQPLWHVTVPAFLSASSAMRTGSAGIKKQPRSPNFFFMTFACVFFFFFFLNDGSRSKSRVRPKERAQTDDDTVADMALLEAFSHVTPSSVLADGNWLRPVSPGPLGRVSEPGRHLSLSDCNSDDFQCMALGACQSWSSPDWHWLELSRYLSRGLARLKLVSINGVHNYGLFSLKALAASSAELPELTRNQSHCWRFSKLLTGPRHRSASLHELVSDSDGALTE